MKKFKRYAMIGVAGGVGGVLIGLTGGLAAPFVAGAASVVVGTGAVAGLATTTGAAIMGSVFGAAGAGLAGYKMKKRVGAIDEFVVESLTEDRSLHCVLCVSGWIDEQDGENAFKVQWRHLMMSKEQYTLRYESKYLMELGKAIDYLMSFAISYAIQHTLMETALAGNNIES
uniref:Zgc:101566 n=1 Tax=Bursaphelenchus xylophilus TaxID=6326 RepID=A0A1I7SIX4_BURXY